MPERVSRLFLLILPLLLLAACAPQQREARMPAEQPLQTGQPPAPDQAQQALQQTQSMSPQNRRMRLLAWAGDYLGKGRVDDARTLLQAIDPQQLQGDTRLQWIVLAAQVKLAANDAAGALDLLNSDKLDVQNLLAGETTPVKIRLQLLRADALTLNGDLVNSLRERVALHPLLSDNDRDYNRRMIWSLLMHLPMSRLETLNQNSQGDLLGWVRLAVLFRNPLVDIDTQAKQLQAWEQQWPDHPAAQHLPDMVQALQQAARRRPQRVAVILPLTGDLPGPGDAIRDGLLTGYYSALNEGHPVPVLQFYDSGSADAITLYNRAIADGAEFVIGPLSKDQVGMLARVDRLPVTTLALNYVDNDNPPQNLYQFGLAPEDEAHEVADQAWQEGARLAGILYPDSDWGHRVAQSFANRWSNLGGLVTAQQSYGEHALRDVGHLLNIDRSNQRAQRLNLLTTLHLQFEPRRRQDLDMIFLVANPEQARQVKPDLNFYYAGNLPVFAISNVYAGRPQPQLDNDLDNIRFVDIPWLLDKDSSLHKLAGRTWPDGHGSRERLFALGVDAYRLQARLLMLQSVPNSELPGVTGRLSVGNNRHLVRHLDWALFRHGKPERMPVITGQTEHKEDVSADVVGKAPGSND